MQCGFHAAERQWLDCPCACEEHACAPVSEQPIFCAFVYSSIQQLATAHSCLNRPQTCRWAGHDFPIMVVLTIFGSFISYIYSAPPLKLKQEGWTGNYALGSSYIALPWWAGQALFGTLSLDVMILTVLYSIAGLGIAIVNDFKSIEGDRQMGLQSLPVAFGIEKAKWICAASIDVTQLSVAAYLWQGLHKPVYAALLLALVLPQVLHSMQAILKPCVNFRDDHLFMGLMRAVDGAV
jgi:bacteriochlorophyll/chlorophyll synthetase